MLWAPSFQGPRSACMGLVDFFPRDGCRIYQRGGGGGGGGEALAPGRWRPSLRQQIFKLPAIRTLNSIINSSTYNRATDELEGVVDSGQFANHASVFMIKSLSANWKQPIGYFVTSGTMGPKILKEKISDCISRLLDVGLDPLVFVCDHQGSNNCSAMKQLGVNVEKPWFSVNGKKMYALLLSYMMHHICLKIFGQISSIMDFLQVRSSIHGNILNSCMLMTLQRKYAWFQN